MKNHKALYLIMALVILIAGTPTNITYASSPSQWAVFEIEEAVKNNLTTPKILSNYQQNITREDFAELAVKLYEALTDTKIPPVSSNTFNDTNNPEILKAHKIGIVSGVSANEFAPLRPITRQEISVILLRTIHAATPQSSYYYPNVKQFADKNLIAPWALEAVGYLNYRGIMGGVGGNRINPRGNTSREQAIALVLRSFKQYSQTTSTLIVGDSFFPYSMDPHATTELPSSRIMTQIYETLLYMDENMNLAPGLAESWRQIDSLTYEFTLKKGVTFHNGETLTAHDVAFTLKRAVESGIIAHIVGRIDTRRINVVNDYTIRISTLFPNSSILNYLTHFSSSILNEKAVLAAGSDYDMNPIGTGPYQLYSYNLDTVELHSYKYYHGFKPKSDILIIKLYPDPYDRLSALEAGEIDISFDIHPNSMNQVKSSKDLTLHSQTNQSTTFVGLNCKNEALSDIRVRQAINYAVDTNYIIEHAYSNLMTPAKGPISPTVWGAHPDLYDYAYNISKAKKLMEESGYINGLKLSIAINHSQSRLINAEILQDQLKLINIDLEIVVLEFDAFLKGISNGIYDMFISGWLTPTGDPDSGLYTMFYSNNYGIMGNYSYYNNEKVDQLLDLARKTADQNMKRLYYYQVQEIVSEEVPWIFVGHGTIHSASKGYINGFIQHPAGHHRLSTVSAEK